MPHHAGQQVAFPARMRIRLRERAEATHFRRKSPLEVPQAASAMVLRASNGCRETSRPETAEPGHQYSTQSFAPSSKTWTASRSAAPTGSIPVLRTSVTAGQMRYLGLLHKRRGRYVECRHVSAHAESVQAQERAELVALDVYRIAEKTGRPITSTGRPAGATAARRCGAATTRAGHCAAVAKARSGQVPVIAVLGLVGSAAWRPPRPPSQAKPSQAKPSQARPGQARGEDHCRDDWCGPANGVTARGAMHCTVHRAPAVAWAHG